MSDIQLAVIGGTGVYNLEALKDIKRLTLSTPFGDPSNDILVGTLGEARIAFIPRHGEGHRIAPSEIPVRANIWALKSLGVRQIISVSAVGSLRQQIEPLHLVVPDQIIDRTDGRAMSFFGGGLVAHVSLAHPFCPALSAALADVAEQADAVVHRSGTCVVINGPRFSTRAESNYYRSMGADIIGMTALPEAQLAREAEICYAAVTAVTDYDAWHDEHEAVAVDMVLRNLARNAETMKRVVEGIASAPPEPAGCDCSNALATALVTPLSLVPDDVKRDLAPIIGRYLERRIDP